MAGKKTGLVMTLDSEKELKSHVAAVNKSITAMKSELFENDVKIYNDLSDKVRNVTLN